jgi:hypothetical protein|nr:MAG TPA: hypothetical protein [Caudoviricetes sp.]
MSKITKHTENATKNQSLASEIIADQATKTKRLEVAVVALSVALLAAAATKRKK